MFHILFSHTNLTLKMEQKRHENKSHQSESRSFDRPKEKTYMNQEKTYYKTKCTDCGAETEVPFKPLEGRPVFCRDCFRKKSPSRN